MFLTDRVVGSSPTGGARKKHLQMQVLFQLSAPSVHEKNEGASLMKCGKPHENQSALYFMRVFHDNEVVALCLQNEHFIY